MYVYQHTCILASLKYLQLINMSIVWFTMTYTVGVNSLTRLVTVAL